MRRNLPILAAAFGLALALIFSCSSDGNGDSGGGGSSGNGSGSGSSSSKGGSSSSNSRQPVVVPGSPETYEGKTYETVVIGTQTWFKSNLNYEPDTGKSMCHDCGIYGRLYDWAAAMALPSSCNSSLCSGGISAKHRGICPEGWHIPSNADWDALMRYVDGADDAKSVYDSETAGRYLKAKSGWSNSGNGEDSYGFAALPGGFGNSDGILSNAGGIGYWWSSSQDAVQHAYIRVMRYNSEGAFPNIGSKNYLFSVRCVKDSG